MVRRPPNFTVANICINNKCARWRFSCVGLLLLVRDLCLKLLGAVVPTGDFNKGAERDALSGDPGDRRISLLEAALIYAFVPWPTSGVTPLWGPGGELQGNKWPECCGFVMLPESKNQSLIMRLGIIRFQPLRHWSQVCRPDKAL